MERHKKEREARKRLEREKEAESQRKASLKKIGSKVHAKVKADNKKTRNNNGGVVEGDGSEGEDEDTEYEMLKHKKNKDGTWSIQIEWKDTKVKEWFGLHDCWYDYPVMVRKYRAMNGFSRKSKYWKEPVAEDVEKLVKVVQIEKGPKSNLKKCTFVVLWDNGYSEVAEYKDIVNDDAELMETFRKSQS